MKPPAEGVARPSLDSPRPLMCECAAVLLSRALLLTSLTGTVAMVAGVMSTGVGGSLVQDSEGDQRGAIGSSRQGWRWWVVRRVCLALC